MRAESRRLRTPARGHDRFTKPTQTSDIYVNYIRCRSLRFGNSTDRCLMLFVQSNRWHDAAASLATAALSLGRGRIECIALLVQSRWASRVGLVGALTAHYGSPGWLADYRRQFERTVQTSVGRPVHIRSIRDVGDKDLWGHGLKAYPGRGDWEFWYWDLAAKPTYRESGAGNTTSTRSDATWLDYGGVFLMWQGGPQCNPGPLTLMYKIGHVSVLQVKPLPLFHWYWCWKTTIFPVKRELSHSKKDPYFSTTLTYILTINNLFIAYLLGTSQARKKGVITVVHTCTGHICECPTLTVGVADGADVAPIDVEDVNIRDDVAGSTNALLVSGSRIINVCLFVYRYRSLVTYCSAASCVSQCTPPLLHIKRLGS